MTASSVDGVMCWASAARLVGFGGEYYNMMGIAHSSSSSSSTYDNTLIIMHDLLSYFYGYTVWSVRRRFLSGTAVVVVVCCEAEKRNK
jgi:hypothetical protein